MQDKAINLLKKENQKKCLEYDSPKCTVTEIGCDRPSADCMMCMCQVEYSSNLNLCLLPLIKVIITHCSITFDRYTYL